MNFGDLPEFKPDIDQLKQQLEALFEKHDISRFEPDDIIELLEDGEAVDWVIEQILQDDDSIDQNKAAELLGSIRNIVGPSEQEIEEEKAAELPEEQITEKEQSEPVAEDQPLDMSQLDFSQLGPELEAMTGMKLPKDMDMNQIKKFMQGSQGKLMTDFAQWCQEQNIDMASISDQTRIHELNEQYMQTPRPAFDGQTPAEATDGEQSLLGFKKVETVRREQPKVGRNDPCPCGSGKKYKKCCGKGK